MYDLHVHILPGIDDGPAEMHESVEMARQAAMGGTKIILATPHRKDVTEGSSVSDLRDLVQTLNRKIQDRATAVSVVLGMENHLDQDLPLDVAEGRALTMNGSRYILVEMPFFGRPAYVEEVLYQLQDDGLVPVLAHPERIEAFQRDPELLAKLVGKGMLSQVTAGSFVGMWGRDVKRFAEHLLAERLVHVLASDAHTPGAPRPPTLDHGVRAAASLLGRDEAERMVLEAPLAILEDRPLDGPTAERSAG
ncbi:MAG: hypothetical protein IIB14_00320 [Chloroflexi bacterium]|nr:hypothetical protein [Chloroflexota bacterium]